MTPVQKHAYTPDTVPIPAMSEPIAMNSHTPPTHPRHGRKQPYTAKGIKRIPCYKCGSPARFQWQLCSDNNIFRPLCTQCDIQLNLLVLQWFRDIDADRKIAKYKAQTLQQT